MKKHFLTTVLALIGLISLSSCLKDEPENNKTIFYAYQQIPNINDYMPQSLLLAMGENSLYYGDEPPMIEGSFTTDNTFVSLVQLIPESHWLMNEGGIQGYRYFKFYDQHMGIAKLNYLYYNMDASNTFTIIERSSNDSTYILSKDYFDQFVADSLTPVYFKDGQVKPNVFNNVYIIGHSPYFTIYYYDVIHTNIFQPLKANIISGRIAEETIIETDTVSGTTNTIVRPVIKDFKWGIEIMKYYKGGTILDMILNPVTGQQTLGKPGDVVIIENPTDVHQGDYQE